MAVSFPTSPTIGQTFTSGSVKYTFNGIGWKASAITYIDSLADVDTASSTPILDNTLVWNGTNWVPGTAASNLGDLNDVVVSGVVTDNVLKYDGTNWIPGTVASASLSFDDLSDVVVSGAASNSLLKYNGDNWSPGQSFIGITSPTPPSFSDILPGTVWINSDTLKQYVYVVDGSSNDVWLSFGNPATTQSVKLSNLGDVNVSGVLTNDVLKYNGTNWAPGTVTGGFVGSTGTLAARPTSPTTNYLYIVSGNTPSNQNGKTYFYNLATTTWIELDTQISNRSIDELSDVNTSGVVANNILRWDGTNWVPQTANINFLTDVDTATSGPTTGQVLQFNGTNWVPSTVSSSASVSSLTDAIITSPSNGQILRYSTTTSKWSNSSESSRERFRNKIVNGDFNVIQREDYSTIQPAAPTTKFYNYDKWYFQQSNSNPYFQFRAGLQYYLDYASEVRSSIFLSSRQAAPTNAGDLHGWFQDIEAYDLEDMNMGYVTAKPMTLSFWVRSGVAGEYPVSLNIGTSYSFVSSYTITSATAADNTALQYVTISVPPFTSAIPAFYNNYAMTLSFGLGVGTNFRTATSNVWVSGNYYANTTSLNLTASANRVIILGKVQLEKGTVATPFEALDYSVALQKCRRYYYSIDSLKGDFTSLEHFIGQMGTVRSTTTQGSIRVTHPVRMRVAPVVTQTGTITARDAGTYTSNATLSSQSTRPDSAELFFTLATAGSTLRPITFSTAANSGRLEFSAEF